MSKVEELVVRVLSDRDWHKLSGDEQRSVTLLEESGHLVKALPFGGFVGGVTTNSTEATIKTGLVMSIIKHFYVSPRNPLRLGYVFI